MKITTTLTPANSALTISGSVLSLVTLLSKAGAPGANGIDGSGYIAVVDYASLPQPGVEGTLYLTEDDDKFWRWDPQTPDYHQVSEDSCPSVGAHYPGPQILSNDGTSIVVSAQTWSLYDNANSVGICSPYDLAQAVFEPPVGVSYIVADYNAGSPAYRLTTDVNEINESNIAPALTVTNEGTKIHVINWDSLGAGLVNKMHRWIVKNFRFRNQSGNVLSEDGSRHVLISTGLANIGAYEYTTQAFNSANATLNSTGPTLFYQWTKVGPLNTDWTFSFVQQYDNLNYNPEAGGLTPLLPNKYVVLWFYRDLDAEPHAAYVRGKNAYSTLAEAKTAQPRNDLPTAFAVNGMLVGRIIVQVGASSGVVESAFSTTFVGSPVTDHESLAGLLGGAAGEHYHLTEEQHVTTENVYVDTQDPTGFIDPSAVVVTGDSTTRNATLTGDLSYYWRGVKKELTAPFTPAIAHTDGADGESRYLSSSDGENFTWGSAVWPFYDIQVCRAVRAQGTWYYFREPHGMMPWQAHNQMHHNPYGGTFRRSGGSAIAGSYTLNADGDAAVTPNFAAAVINDEDLPSTLAQVDAGAYAHCYFSGARVLNFAVDQALPYRVGGTYPLINTPTAGVFADVETTTNRYFNVYQILSPAAADTGSQKIRMQFLQPQASFSSLAAAQAENPFTLDTAGIGGFGLEQCLLTRLTYGTNAAYTATGKVRLLALAEVTSRLNINGLGAAATTAENVTFTPSGNIAATNVQTAIQEVDTKKLAHTAGTITDIRETKTYEELTANKTISFAAADVLYFFINPAGASIQFTMPTDPGSISKSGILFVKNNTGKSHTWNTSPAICFCGETDADTIPTPAAVGYWTRYTVQWNDETSEWWVSLAGKDTA